MAVTAALIKELRERTGVGMSACKKLTRTKLSVKAEVPSLSGIKLKKAACS